MAARKKHIRTSYGDKRKEHRAAASRHVLVLEAQINENDKRRDFCCSTGILFKNYSPKMPRCAVQKGVDE